MKGAPLGGIRRERARVVIDLGHGVPGPVLLADGLQEVPRDGRVVVARGRRPHHVQNLPARWQGRRRPPPGTCQARPVRESPETILETYNAELFDFYEAAGGDLTSRHALGRMLGENGSNRPAYGWARRRNSEPRVAHELAVVLRIAARKESARTVALLLWAGADPRARAAYVESSSSWRRGEDDLEEDDYEDGGSAISDAVEGGLGKLLLRLRPDPALDDFDHIWKSVRDVESIEILAGIQLPTDWSPALYWNLERALSEYGNAPEVRRRVDRMLAPGARLTFFDRDREQLRSLRRSLLRGKDESTVRWALQLLRQPDRCSPEVFFGLTRTTAIRKLSAALHVPLVSIRSRVIL